MSLDWSQANVFRHNTSALPSPPRPTPDIETPQTLPPLSLNRQETQLSITEDDVGLDSIDEGHLSAPAGLNDEQLDPIFYANMTGDLSVLSSRSSSPDSEDYVQTSGEGLQEWQSSIDLDNLDPSQHLENGSLSNRSLSTARMPANVVNDLYLYMVWQEVFCGVPRAFVDEGLSFLCKRLLTSTSRASHAVKVATLRKRIGLSDPFVSYVVCPVETCFQLHLSVAEVCQRCGESLLKGRNGLLPGSSLWHRPDPILEARKTFVYHPIATFLKGLVLRPGMTEMLNLWRHRSMPKSQWSSSPNDVHFSDVQHGQRWQEEQVYLDNGELNLELALSVDWFQPFNFAASYPCGPIFVSILNLPAELRLKEKYVHLVGVIPGDKEPPWHSLCRVLEPLFAELDHLENGIDVEVEDKETGVLTIKRLRARLMLFVGDTPARNKVGGFVNHMSRKRFCPFCDIDFDRRIPAALGSIQPRPYNADNFQRQQVSLVNASSRYQQESSKETSALPCGLNRLSYWRSVRDCPVDPMHALLLGSVKRLWHQLLVEGRLLSRTDIDSIQQRMSTMTVPFPFQRFSERLGSRRGGSPTASQLATLGRVLPWLLASAWTDSINHYETHKDTVKSAILSPHRHTISEVERRRHWSVYVRPGSQTRQDPSLADGDGGDGVIDGGADAEDGPENERLIHKGWLVTEVVMPLSRAVTLMLKAVISSTELDELASSIQRFVAGLGTIPFLTYNSHIISHLADHIKAFGCPRVFWAFPFESFNRRLMMTVRRSSCRHGQVEKTMMRIWHQRQQLDAIAEDTGSPEVKELFSLRAGKNGVASVDSPYSWTLSDVIEVGARCSPSAGLVDNAAQSTAQKAKPLTKDLFQRLFCLLDNSREPEEEPYVVESLFSPQDRTQVPNVVECHATLTFQGMFFSSLASRRNVSIANTYAFIRQGIDSEPQAVQILDIFKHQFHRRVPNSRAVVDVTRTFLYARVFEPSYPDYYVEPSQLDCLNPIFVKVRPGYTTAIIAASDLVSNAAVIAHDSFVSVFAMTPVT